MFREIQEINKNDFDLKEEEEPIDFVETLCETLQVATLYIYTQKPKNVVHWQDKTYWSYQLNAVYF